MAASTPAAAGADRVGVLTTAKELMDSSSSHPEKLHVVMFWAEYNPATIDGSQNAKLLSMLAAKETEAAFFKVSLVRNSGPPAFGRTSCAPVWNRLTWMLHPLWLTCLTFK